ncbi:MAG: FeoB-associated Cys-rich membrane protein [Ndongobacter sp.]|nr:FeoB-associated Cys-rich membrane protein [Ndongobacter sp.]
MGDYLRSHLPDLVVLALVLTAILFAVRSLRKKKGGCGCGCSGCSGCSTASRTHGAPDTK